MATVQVVDRIHGMLAELFADAPYVRKLGYEAYGTNVLLRAVFEEDDDYEGRLGEVVDRFVKFEEAMAGGAMPEIEVRMQALPVRLSLPDEMRGLEVVLDR